MDQLFIVNYLRGLLARLGQGGWRPFFGWGLGLMCLMSVKFALIDAPRQGVQLDPGYYNFLLGVLGIFVATFITREVGKHLERKGPPPAHVPSPSPSGGLVNQAAIS